MSGSGISWAICKSAPCSRQITMPTPHHSVYTGRMPFLSPNQQRQSTEGKCSDGNWTQYYRKLTAQLDRRWRHMEHCCFTDDCCRCYRPTIDLRLHLIYCTKWIADFPTLDKFWSDFITWTALKNYHRLIMLHVIWFQHPYPSEDQKKDLSEQTGLTMSQVNNWYDWQCFLY